MPTQSSASIATTSPSQITTSPSFSCITAAIYYIPSLFYTTTPLSNFITPPSFSSVQLLLLCFRWLLALLSSLPGQSQSISITLSSYLSILSSPKSVFASSLRYQIVLTALACCLKSICWPCRRRVLATSCTVLLLGFEYVVGGCLAFASFLF